MLEESIPERLFFVPKLKRGGQLIAGRSYLMSQALQLPEHPCRGEASSEQAAVPSISRVSCTAHLMPRRCMSLLVEISESM